MPVTPKDVDDVRAALAGEGEPVLHLSRPAAAPPGVPPPWIDALSQPDPKRFTFETLWKPIAARMPRTHASLVRAVQGVALVLTRSQPPSLVYFMRRGGRVRTRRGYPPQHPARPEAASLPPAFLDFYKVHDGWGDLLSPTMGPMPSREWNWLEPGADSPAGRFLYVFHNGGNMFMGFDFDESPPLCYVISSDEEEDPEPVSDIVAELDEWMAAQLEDMDPA